MRAPAFSLLAILLLFKIPSVALQKYEHVTVTGSKTESINIRNPHGFQLSKTQLEDQNVFHTDNVWNFIPNLNTAGGSNRLRFIQIRGVGERSEFDSVPTNSVGFYYDHIDLSGLGGVVATYDTENFQVLKGPQSHLFGDSSIGGNVLISSSWEPESKTVAWAGYGSQSRTRTGIKTQKQLGEHLNLKVGIQKQRSDGFIKNTYLNKNTNDLDELFATAGINYMARGFDLRTSHLFADQKNGYDAWSISDDKFSTLTDRPGRDEQKTWGHSIEFSKSVSKQSKLLVIASNSDSNINHSFDEDWGNNPFWNQVPGWSMTYDYKKLYERKRKHFHSKAIFQKNIPLGFFNLGFHYTNRADDTLITSFKDGLERKKLKSRYNSKHFAFLAGMEKEILKNLKFNLSGRLEDQDITYSDSNSFTASPGTRLYGFNASFSRKLKNHSLVFTLSRGFKGAGFNPEINLTREQQFYSPESLLNHELTWLFSRKKWSTKFTLFYMDRDNQQIQTSSQVDPNDPSNFTVFIDNAAKTENYGLETEVDFHLSSALDLNFSLGLLKARFKSYKLEGVDRSGRSLAHSPLYSFAFRSVLRASSNLSFNLNFTGRDEFYFSNSHDHKSSSYALIGAGAEFRPSPSTKISFWGRNIFSKTYAARGFYFGNEPPNFEPKVYTQAAAPLELGLDVEIKF